MQFYSGATGQVGRFSEGFCLRRVHWRSMTGIHSPCVPAHIAVVEAQRQDAAAIAAIHLTARRQAMPYLRLAHTDDETRDHFARVVASRPQAWWVVRHQGQVAAYMLLDGESLDHLYAAPGW